MTNTDIELKRKIDSQWRDFLTAHDCPKRAFYKQREDIIEFVLRKEIFLKTDANGKIFLNSYGKPVIQATQPLSFHRWEKLRKDFTDLLKREGYQGDEIEI